MSSVLNQVLYNALTRAFGEVRITNAGVTSVVVMWPGPYGERRPTFAASGETYQVCCPYCNDTRFRLNINHMWGQCVSEHKTRFRWAAHCFNEDCLASKENRDDLRERTTWYHRHAKAGTAPIRAGACVAVPNEPVPLPEDFVTLDELTNDHPVRAYLRERAFDPDEIGQRWGVGYATRLMGQVWRSGRLVIPISGKISDAVQTMGWIARRLDEFSNPKYLTAKGFKKSHFLYGVERLTSGTSPVLVCEGPTDVWRAGENALALIGKKASADQIKLLVRVARGRPIVVALDPDARDECEDLVRTLRDRRLCSLLRPDDAPVAALLLSHGHDPADYSRDELWELVQGALR
jgi:hypothetical protein